MKPSIRRRTLFLFTGFVVCAGGVMAGSQGPPARAQPPPEENLCLRGRRLFTAGDTAGAETVFVAQLARDSKRACALSNLGNLARLRDDLDLAQILYRMAYESDSTDAGILLNYAALLHQQKDARADSVYRRALELSGAEEVLRKLGIEAPTEEVEEAKGMDLGEILKWGGPGHHIDTRVSALIRRAMKDVERTKNGPPSGGPTLSPDEQEKQEEQKRADTFVLANLPLYWKD